MTINKTIRMELLSDLCAASGDGFAGVVDADVHFDNLGFPFIPGKRVKGCLRECGMDILSVDTRYLECFKSIFGETGQSAPGGLTVGNGYLEDHQKYVQNINGVYPSELAEAFTNTRTRTKMKGGKAAPGSLRTMRSLKKGQVYEFPISLKPSGMCTCKYNDKAGEICHFLTMCINSFRAMGLNRSRGFGEIKCKIIDNPHMSETAFDLYDFGDQKAFSYTIKLLEPVIAAHRSGKPLDCEDFIFGSAIAGVFATRYIEKNKEITRTDAYTDKNFRRIFLEGEVKFTAAMPCDGDCIFYPAPAMLKTNKIEKDLFDESMGIAKEKDSKNPICKRLSGFISMSKNIVLRHNTSKTTFVHHARPVDKGESELFSYEALAEGQCFAGSVIGEEKDLLCLARMFKEDNIIRIGRSRTAQYGKAVIHPKATKMSSNCRKLKKGDTFRLVALSPIIPENEKGINTTDLSTLAGLIDKDLEVTRYACSETIIAGYNAKWLLPRTQERAIAEGSVIVFKYNGDGVVLKENFVGKRTGEGFGQIRFEDVPASKEFEFPDKDNINKNTNNTLPAKSSGILEVDWLRNQKKAVSAGTVYGEKQVTAPKNSTLQRIAAILKKASSFAEFSKLICEIRQDRQKTGALALACDKEKEYFDKTPEYMEQSHVKELIRAKKIVLYDLHLPEEHHLNKLLKGKCYDFYVYEKYLTAAIQRIKQARQGEAAIKQTGGDDK